MPFSHLDADGSAVMVDIADKELSKRQAKAVGRIHMSPECYAEVCAGTAAKGDVLSVSRIAGIMAAKQTSSLIPLCHTLLIDKVEVDFEFSDDEHMIIANCTVKTTGKTGVEMEALTGVSVALLTIYDMCKAVDKGMSINNIHLAYKTGGKCDITCKTGRER